MLLALSIGYDFSAPAPARLVSMAAFTGLLMLTRRSYMFTVAAFFVLYSVWVLVRAALQKQGKAALRFAKFAVTSLICVGVPLVPMFWRIVMADYGDRYATYQTAAFWPSWTTCGATWGISSGDCLQSGFCTHCIKNKQDF